MAYDAHGIYLALLYESAGSSGSEMAMKFYKDADTSVTSATEPGVEATSMAISDLSNTNISIGVSDSPTYGAKLTVDTEGKSSAYSSSGNIGTTTADIRWIILEWNPVGQGSERLAAASATDPITVADGQQITVQTGTEFFFEGDGTDDLTPDTNATVGNWENTAMLRAIRSFFTAVVSGSVTLDSRTWDQVFVRYQMTDNDNNSVTKEHVGEVPKLNTGNDPNYLYADTSVFSEIELDSGFEADLDAIEWGVRDKSDSNSDTIIFKDESADVVDGDGQAVSNNTISGPGVLYPDFFEANV